MNHGERRISVPTVRRTLLQLDLHKQSRLSKTKESQSNPLMLTVQCLPPDSSDGF